MKTKFHIASEPIKKLRHITAFLHNHIPNAFPQPLLAGGALRDDYMGHSEYINDYDIFIRDISESLEAGQDFEETVGKMIQQVFPQHEGYEILFDNEYQTLQEQQDSKADVKPGSHEQIASVWEIEEDGDTYQLVFTKNDPIIHVEKYFDLGFCKAWCDGKKIRYTDDFLYDVKHKTLTIVGDDMTAEQVEHTINYHADKIQWKYDGFRVVVPPRYQKFVKDLGFPTF
jgi:hypothetical protein